MNVEIAINKICNLSRIPMPIINNPLRMTVLEIMESPDICYKDTTIYRYFNKNNPTTLSEFYHLDDGVLSGFPAKSIFLPWLHSKPVIEYSDECFFGYKENQYVKSKVDKLRRLSASIIDKGYQPEKYVDRKRGHITGYFLHLGNDEKFYVISGNHRVAVLAAISDNQKIPVIFELCEYLKSRDKLNNEIYKRYCTKKRFMFGNKHCYPTVFSNENIKAWPSVKSCFFTQDQALNVFKKYFGV